MSAIQFLIGGGMASIGGDLLEIEREGVNNVIKDFGGKVRKYALTLQIPASLLSVQQSNFLFIAKDVLNYHVIFASTPGVTTINYRDFTSHGRVDLQSIVRQVMIEVGEVLWSFSYPINTPSAELENHIQKNVEQYVNTVLLVQRKSEKTVSEEAVSTPEIASGIEKFRRDYPLNKKTAFIMMPFNSTRLHDEILTCIKETLELHGIVGLRADDVEYMDELFPNVKVYMHTCDFGIAVFDRITSDNFNPNVSLEVGYMLGMGKNVLFLKDKTLITLQSDLTGKLYKSFDTTDISNTIPEQINKWLIDKGLR